MNTRNPTPPRRVVREFLERTWTLELSLISRLLGSDSPPPVPSYTRINERTRPHVSSSLRGGPGCLRCDSARSRPPEYATRADRKRELHVRSGPRSHRQRIHQQVCG